jgi:hypothetical protein
MKRIAIRTKPTDTMIIEITLKGVINLPLGFISLSRKRRKSPMLPIWGDMGSVDWLSTGTI